jgi:hypothetical protein
VFAKLARAAVPRCTVFIGYLQDQEALGKRARGAQMRFTCLIPKDFRFAVVTVACSKILKAVKCHYFVTTDPSKTMKSGEIDRSQIRAKLLVGNGFFGFGTTCERCLTPFLRPPDWERLNEVFLHRCFHTERRTTIWAATRFGSFAALHIERLRGLMWPGPSHYTQDSCGLLSGK